MTLRTFFKEALKSPAAVNMAIGGASIATCYATGQLGVAVGIFLMGQAAKPEITHYLEKKLG